MSNLLRYIGWFSKRQMPQNVEPEFAEPRHEVYDPSVPPKSDEMVADVSTQIIAKAQRTEPLTGYTLTELAEAASFARTDLPPDSPAVAHIEAAAERAMLAESAVSGNDVPIALEELAI